MGQVGNAVNADILRGLREKTGQAEEQGRD